MRAPHDLSPAPRAALRVNGVHKAFRDGQRETRALQGASLIARTGNITGLIGPDGAGKTTLMRMISGLLRPDRGEIKVLGIDAVAEPLKVQGQLGYMPQRFGLYEDLSVRENLDLYADLHSVPASARPGRYEELLHMTGLAPFTARLAGRLSGGMKQKLGLACTLVQPPRLLLLDEPTVGVDPVSRRELWQIIERLVGEQDMSVLLATAYLDEAERCTEVVLLHEGRLLGQGAPQHFTEGLEARVWYAERRGGSRRRLLTELQDRPEILDAIIDRDGVRAILDTAGAPPALAGTTWQPLRPTFEDAFVERLSHSVKPGTTRRPSPKDAGQHDHATVISAHGLTRRFGDFYAVRGVDFEVRRGEIFGLLGANGAGKSTTFRMLCGLLPPSDGELSVAGVNLRKAASAARARIGYMAQKFSLYGHLSVMQNLRFFSRSYGLRGKRQRERIDWALQDFRLGSLGSSSANELPLGYKQRLAMACALMHEPDILFLDEPTSGIDPLERRAFWTRINALADSGVTIMVTTHFMEEAEYCDHLVIMAQGRILTAGTPQEVRAHSHIRKHLRPSMEDAFIKLTQAAEKQPDAT